MLDFHNFETFDPNGPGLGNLFGQVSPFEALGIWPSGDFRLAPGDGAVPAVGYYLGAAFALVLLLYGIARCWRRRESAVLAGLGAAVLAYAAARLGGTPYTAAKAIEIGAAARRPDHPPAAARPTPWASFCRYATNKSPSRAVRLPPWSSLPPPASARCSRSPTRRSGRPPTRRRSRAAAAGRRRLDPRPRLRRAARRRARRALHLLGAARRARLHRRRERSGGGTAARRALRRHPRRPGRAALPGLRVRRVAAPYVLWESTRPVGVRRAPAPDRRPPGRQRPARSLGARAPYHGLGWRPRRRN